MHVVRQVKVVRSVLVFAPPKGGKLRDVPLPDEVGFALALWRDQPTASRFRRGDTTGFASVGPLPLSVRRVTGLVCSQAHSLPRVPEVSPTQSRAVEQVRRPVASDHSIAEQSKNYRHSTNHQVVIDADTRLVVAVGRPLPGNRNDCKAWTESGAKAAVGRTTTIADGGYPGTGLLIPHRRPAGGELCGWKKEHNRFHKQVRARVEHVFARMKTWKILRDCRLKGDGVHHAMLGISRLHNLNQAA